LPFPAPCIGNVVVVRKLGPEGFEIKNFKIRLDESTNRMKTRVQLFYTYPH
jgi:hypothetical protein